MPKDGLVRCMFGNQTAGSIKLCSICKMYENLRLSELVLLLNVFHAFLKNSN